MDPGDRGAALHTPSGGRSKRPVATAIRPATGIACIVSLRRETAREDERMGSLRQGPGQTWFLAQLKPNAAKIAEANLTRQGFRTFLPQQEGTRRLQGKFVTVQRLLFPGYIFVAFDVANGGWRAINSTSGVTRLVSFGKDPASVPGELVAQLRLRCDPSGTLLPFELLKPGDRVRVTSGPFAEVIAEIESLAPDRRVWALLDIMGAKARVAIDPGHLRQI